MKISDGYDFNKVDTKERLINLLKIYKGILNQDMFDYLNSLIELEFSIVREYISEDNKKSLAELEIYKRIAIYNIYYRCLNLFKENKVKYNSSGNENKYEGLKIFRPLNSDTDIKVFDFEYKGFYSNGFNIYTVLDDYKTMFIGNISLYQTLEDKKMKELELNRIMKELEALYDEKNPYPIEPKRTGGPRVSWEYRRRDKIKKYEELFTQLDSKKELTDNEKREIEITANIYNLLLEDYGLTNDSFEEETKQILKSDESILEKNLLKNNLIYWL